MFGTLFSSHILKLNLNKFFCLAVCFQFKFWVVFTYIVEDYPLPHFFFLFFGHPFSPPHTWPTTPSPISLFFSPTTHLLHFFPLTCSDLTHSIFTSFLFLLNPQSSVVHPKIHSCISVLQFASVNTLLEGPPTKFLEDLNSRVLGGSVEAKWLEKKKRKKKTPSPYFFSFLFFSSFFPLQSSPSLASSTIFLFLYFPLNPPSLTSSTIFFFFLFSPSIHPHRLRNFQL